MATPQLPEAAKRQVLFVVYFTALVLLFKAPRGHVDLRTGVRRQLQHEGFESGSMCCYLGLRL